MTDESPVSLILSNGDRRTEDQQGRHVLANGQGRGGGTIFTTHIDHLGQLSRCPSPASLPLEKLTDSREKVLLCSPNEYPSREQPP